MTTQIPQEEIEKQIKCVSHEIRNHLSICDMYSQIIKKNLEKEGITNSSVSNALECIQKSIQIIGTNLLDLKSMNNENPKIYDFEKIITHACDMAKAYIIDKNIEFEVFVKNTSNIYIDENRFLACLVNIIKNGIESIDLKGKIEVLAEVKDNEGIIKLSNNGKTIPKEKQKEIFTQGYTTKQNGCGLGLAICKSFLESQSAKLSLTKSTKEKTTFEIRIPISA